MEYAVPHPQAPDPNPRATTRSRKMLDTVSPSPARSALVAHISAQTGSLPPQDDCVHIFGIRPETYLLQDHLHRTYICPFCHGIRNCPPEDIVAHRMDTHRNNIHSQCTSLSSATQTPDLSGRNNPPDKLLRKARLSNAYMQQRLSALRAFRLGWGPPADDLHPMALHAHFYMQLHRHYTRYNVLHHIETSF